MASELSHDRNNFRPKVNKAAVRNCVIESGSYVMANVKPLSIWGVGPVLALWGVSAFFLCGIVTYLLGAPIVIPVSIGWKILGGVFGLLGVYFWISSAVMVVRDVPKGKLMTSGVFGLCRNPMYAGFILFLLPAAALLTGVWVLLSASVVMALVFPSLIRTEEDALKTLFGKEYLDYYCRTPMLVPVLPRTVQAGGSVGRRFAGQGVFPHQMAFTLLVPLRNIFLSPRTLIERLELKSDHVVLEIGPGPGYFSVAVARYLSDGTLYLLDIQQEMLDIARQRLKKQGQSNVQYHCADGKSFPFGDRAFDRIFMVTVLGEVENQEAYVKEISRTMKPDGVVSISEMAGDPDKMKDNDVKVLFEAAGFKCCREFRTLWGCTLNFRKCLA